MLSKVLSLAAVGIIIGAPVPITLTEFAIAQTSQDRKTEADRLLQQGVEQYQISQFEAAFQAWQQALTIYRQIQDRSGEGNALGNLGIAYYALGKFDKAIEFQLQRLLIARELKDRSGEGIVLGNLGATFNNLKQSELAILFYKQSINVREAIRKDISKLDKDIQKSYVATVENTYRNLASLLLTQGRISEALQVLDLLKVQELEDYFKILQPNAATEKGISLLPPEQTLGAQLNFNLSSQQYSQLNQQLASALKQLPASALNPIFDSLRQLPKNTALLYPIVLSDRVELVLFIPNQSPINRTIRIESNQLDRLINQFREDLRDPSSLDVRESSQKLHDLLFKPIAADLTRANIKTILYAPDKQLRYIPLTALYDGKQWLVEKYQIAYLISYNLANFNPAPRSTPRILAGALGNQKVAGLSPLPATLPEVEAISRSLPDTQTLVEQSFTAPAIQENVSGRSILHFATHAEFNPTSPALSFVLMGDGKKLSLPELRQWNLKGMDLVVLSACQTGVGGFGQGIEILGFGYQMQLAGAKITLSSLWSVSDGGTQVLMDSFYNSFAQQKDVITSMREAQIAMIRRGDNLSPDRKRGFESLRSGLPAKAQGKLNHPFYWSPFIVIVNQF